MGKNTGNRSRCDFGLHKDEVRECRALLARYSDGRPIYITNEGMQFRVTKHGLSKPLKRIPTQYRRAPEYIGIVS